MRAPFQILAIPYKKTPELQFCVLRRSDNHQYQFVAGGGENDETPLEAAMREIREETAVHAEEIIQLTSMAYVPANVVSEEYRNLWPAETFVIPEYAFGFACDTQVVLSHEHRDSEWLAYSAAMSKLTWDSNKTALYELNCRLIGSEQ